MSAPLGLFEGFGIELEYMIVNQHDLSVLPIADRLLERAAGVPASDFDDGPISWSNELVMHVIELKTSAPVPTLRGLDELFDKSLQKIKSILDSYSAGLLPTAMHPFMSPLTETRIWPHDNNEIYDTYNRIFDCRGHGWSNLQSTHINLPFKDDDEFRRLHIAIRALLPIMPALTASSPVVEGSLTGIKDNRLLFYQRNQIRIPSIAGQVIPEPVTSRAEYEKQILSRIYSDIAPFDPAENLRDDWLNSRGAIARFGRQTIEIRVLDTQECPKADIALAVLICATLKQLAGSSPQRLDSLQALSTDALKNIFDDVVVDGEDAVISDSRFLRALGFSDDVQKAGDLWKALLARHVEDGRLGEPASRTLETILRQGTLSTRIARALGPAKDLNRLREVYQRLGECLSSNKLFLN